MFSSAISGSINELQTKEYVWFVCIVVNGASMQTLDTETQAMTVVQIAILRTILL